MWTQPANHLSSSIILQKKKKKRLLTINSECYKGDRYQMQIQVEAKLLCTVKEKKKKKKKEFYLTAACEKK